MSIYGYGSNVLDRCTRVQQAVSMSLGMQVRSGEPKLFDSASAWGEDEGPASRSRGFNGSACSQLLGGAFAGACLSDARRYRPTPEMRQNKSHVSLPASQERAGPVGVDDASPRCSAQSRLESVHARASWPCKPPQTASKPPCLLVPTTPEAIPFAFGPLSPIPCVTINHQSTPSHTIIRHDCYPGRSWEASRDAYSNTIKHRQRILTSYHGRLPISVILEHPGRPCFLMDDSTQF